MPGRRSTWAREPRPLVLPDLPRKEDRACCTSRRDSSGRLPIGFCSPGCEGRIARDRLRAEAQILRERRSTA